MNKEKRRLVSFQKVSIVSLSSMLAVLQLSLFLGKNVDQLKVLTQNNMLTYGCAILLFLLICLVGSIQMLRVHGFEGAELPDKESQFSIATQKKFYAIAITIAAVLWFHAEFISKKNEFAVNESLLFKALSYKPIPIVYCISCVTVMAFVICYARRTRDLPIKAVWITELFVCASEFFNKSFFDLFNSERLASMGKSLLFADLFHGVAYRESIYNAYYGVPYTLETTGVYGHYGLLFKPFMHLFHGNPIALSVLLALIQVFCALCLFYILHHICSKNWIRCLGALAIGMPAVLLEHRNYWQACPHRILFPLVILAFFTNVARNDRWSNASYVIAFILGMLAFIWNTETGLFCLVMICAVFTLHRWQHEKWFSPKTWAYEGGLVLASAVCGVLCVNLYNIACGGSWILKDFFFPLFTKSYMLNSIGHAAPAGNYSWVYISLTFAFLLLFCLYKTSFFCSSSKDKYISVMAGVAVIGLLNLTYYMNRAAYGNLCITIHFAVLALCYFSERFLPYFQQMFQKSCERIHIYAAFICTICIAVLTFCSINTFGVLPKACVSSGRFDTTQLIASAEQIRKSVPEDTYAIGTGMTELYALNGWDTHAHFRDFADLGVGGTAAFDAVLEETLQHDSFLFYPGFFGEGNELLRSVLAEAPYQLIEEIPIESGIVYYYAK